MKKRKKRRKNKLDIKKVKLLLLIIIIIFAICIIINKKDEPIDASTYSISEIPTFIEQYSYANVSRYIVYGTHFNIEGNMEIQENNIKNAQVVLKNESGDEITINSNYTYSNNLLSFSTINKINTGLDLETLNVANYFILLKVEYSNGETKYYSLSNDTEYGNIEYYTLTRNNTNNKININFTSFNNVPLFMINMNTVNKLPDDVYDIVIDPGHGGNDGGAENDGYVESEVVLECAQKLKTKLEEIGLKVLLTRDGTESPEEYTANNMYDKDGRVTIANESGAKILVSLHLNSNEVDISHGGVEVYASPNSDLALASLFADNIVEKANTTYSQMESYKEEEGVYVRTIEIDRDRNNSLSTYNSIFDSIPYLYIIREVGGIITGAYVSGNDQGYSENIYRNSNVGLEAYLIELGYMNVEKDLRNILRNQDLYMQAIADSINTFYSIT